MLAESHKGSLPSVTSWRHAEVLVMHVESVQTGVLAGKVTHITLLFTLDFLEHEVLDQVNSTTALQVSTIPIEIL